MNATILKYKNKIKSFDNPFINAIIKHSLKYFSATIISAIVGMMMNKYYTFVFSPAKFGILSLYLTLFNYMQNLIAFNIDASAQRVYFDYKGEERKQFLGTVLIFMTSSAVFWLLVSFFMKDIVVKNFGGNGLMFYITMLLSVAFMYFNFFNRIGFNEHLSNLVFRQGLIQTIVNHLGSFLLITYIKLDILGRQLAQLLAFCINVFFYGKKLRHSGYLNVEFTFKLYMLRRLAHFALPSFCSTVLVATFSYLDRIFLNYYHGAKEVGIYSLGFTVGQGISFAVEAVSMAMFPCLMNELQKEYKTNIKKLKQFDLIFCIGLVLMGLFVYGFRDLIIKILSNHNYQNAADVLPFVAFGFVLGGFYKAVSSVLSFHNVVWFYPILSGVSFSFTAVLNFLLIPKFNIIGAAYANFLGLFLYSLAIHIIGSKYYFKLHHIFIIYGCIFTFITILFLRLALII